MGVEDRLDPPEEENPGEAPGRKLVTLSSREEILAGLTRIDGSEQFRDNFCPPLLILAGFKEVFIDTVGAYLGIALSKYLDAVGDGVVVKFMNEHLMEVVDVLLPGDPESAEIVKDKLSQALFKVKSASPEREVQTLTQRAVPVVPFDVGGLEEKDFVSLTRWQSIEDPDGYGFLQRIGLKRGLVNAEGEPMLLVCMFVVLAGFGGKKMTPKMAERFNKEKLPGAMRAMALALSPLHENVVVVNLKPPEYMMEELRALGVGGLDVER